MELSNAQRAEVLIHALPYIQKYYNKIIVVKYGGNAMINEDLKKAVDIPETVQDWGVDEKAFLDVVDNMSEWAFHDACTGCNPVYPTFEELKECYLRAYYGDKTFEKLYAGQKITVNLPLDRHADTPVACSDPALLGGFM